MKNFSTDWHYQGNTLHEAPQDVQGFVYLITNTSLDKRYIGKKNFWRVKKLPPLKGRKNKRHQTVESDWRTYWGSNEQLKQDLQRYGKDCFRREILQFCATKSWMAYHETRLQFSLGVLLGDDWYNNFIGCKIHGNHLRTDND